MIKRRNIILTLLLLMLPIWFGCTQEDYRNCPAGLYIAFDPQNPKHVYPDEVQNVSLYFFDPATGDLAAQYDYLKEELRESDRAAFVPQMASGNYRVVAVINNGIYAQTSGVENYATLRTTLDQESMDYKPEHNFFTSEKQITVAVNTTEEIPVERMTIVKHNNDVHLNIIYDGYVLEPGSTLDSWIEGSGAQYQYATQVNYSGVQYTPWAVRTDDTDRPTRFSFTTMRLCLASDLTIHLQESSASRAPMRAYSFNITEQLSRIIDEVDPDNEFLYDTDFELEFHDEYEITIKLGRDKVQISVGIGLWDTIGGGVEL